MDHRGAALISRFVLFAAATASVASLVQASPPLGAEQLRMQSAEFRREVIQVSKGVHVAVGYSASNVTLIQGQDGVIIVDTGTDPIDAQAIRAAFGPLLNGPVRAIIYTHSHPDHTGGSRVFANRDAPQIWSHASLLAAAPDLGRANRDGGDQFGIALPADQFINAGVQQQFGRLTPPTREGYIPPNHTFTADRRNLKLAGIPVTLFHTPGESQDTIAVWLPDRRVVIAGDNLLRSFPNVAPIRGARFRSPEDWITSLNRILSLHAEALVPGHTRPILGSVAVSAVTTAYRDGIQSILQQTLAGIRNGERPDELVTHVRLPAELESNPWLAEFYGSVEWLVRGIYADRLGWFDGNAAGLFPLSSRDRAARLLPLLGERSGVIAKAQQALAVGDYRWAAELADLILALKPADQEARILKADALTALAEQQMNAIARNYYLTVAQSLRKLPD